MENTDETKGRRKNFWTTPIKVLLLVGLILYVLRVEAALQNTARKEDMARLVMDLTGDVATIDSFWMLEDRVIELESAIQRFDGYFEDVPTYDELWMLEDRVIELEDSILHIEGYFEDVPTYDDIWLLEDRINELEDSIQYIFDSLEEAPSEE